MICFASVFFSFSFVWETNPLDLHLDCLNSLALFCLLRRRFFFSFSFVFSFRFMLFLKSRSQFIEGHGNEVANAQETCHFYTHTRNAVCVNLTMCIFIAHAQSLSLCFLCSVKTVHGCNARSGQQPSVNVLKQNNGLFASTQFTDAMLLCTNR